MTFLAGALRATGFRGLQPAMDHIIENQDKPVPDSSSQVEQKSSAMAVDDDDEDSAALAAIIAKGGNAASAVEQEAKVCFHLYWIGQILRWSLVDQVLDVWQGLQEHCTRQFPR